MDGALVGAGSPWPSPNTSTIQLHVSTYLYTTYFPSSSVIVANFVM
jgi:hypothetical protein